MIRAFLAITPPPQIKSNIAHIIKRLHTQFPFVRWENPQKVHLTLAFLGALSQEKLVKLRTVLKDITREVLPFELTVTNLSYFHKKHADSIVFLNVEDRTKALRSVYRTLMTQLTEERIFLPQRLAPHITIGRVKRTRFPHEVKNILHELSKVQDTTIERFTVDAIDLYESLYSKEVNTTQYRILQSFQLSRE